MNETRRDIEFTTEVGRIDMKTLGTFYESVGFGKAENYEVPQVSLERLFGPGTYGFFAFDDGRLVGMARVFSDDVLCTWIAEMGVHPAWQGRGIGGALLDRINERFSHTALYAEPFVGQEALFAGRGIKVQSRLTACGRAAVRS